MGYVLNWYRKYLHFVDQYSIVQSVCVHFTQVPHVSHSRKTQNRLVKYAITKSRNCARSWKSRWSKSYRTHCISLRSTQGRSQSFLMNVKCFLSFWPFRLSYHLIFFNWIHTLARIIERNGSRPPFTYNQFQGIIESMDPPPQAVPAVAPETVESSTTPTSDDHDDRFGVPSLDELGR